MKIEGYSTIKEIEVGYFECEKCGYYNTGFDVCDSRYSVQNVNISMKVAQYSRND